jgi:hypothetical protein
LPEADGFATECASERRTALLRADRAAATRDESPGTDATMWLSALGRPVSRTEEQPGSDPDRGPAAGSDAEKGPGGRAALVEALRVRQNAVRGTAVGVLFAALVFLVFVVLAPGTDQSMPYYLALWFVLALAVSGLATTVLVALRAYRLVQEL